MARRPRFATGGYVFHVLNRAVARAALFTEAADYEAFLRILGLAGQIVPMRLLGWCLLSNPWHLVLWPYKDGDLSEYVRWLTVTHTQRWHAAHGTSGTGPCTQKAQARTKPALSSLTLRVPLVVLIRADEPS